MLWNYICSIFDVLNFRDMKTQERILRDSKGNDIGVRENQRGAMYIDHRVFFSLQKTQDIMKTLSESRLVADIRAKRDKRNKK
jgi:hypothetical protein